MCEGKDTTPIILEPCEQKICKKRGFLRQKKRGYIPMKKRRKRRRLISGNSSKMKMGSKDITNSAWDAYILAARALEAKLFDARITVTDNLKRVESI